MPEPDLTDDQALRRFQARVDVFSAAQERPATVGHGAAEAAAGQAYRILADLVGGVLVGLGLGFALDRLTGVTAPWGLIGGVLSGFAVSVWMAKRTADRLMAQAKSQGPAQPLPAAMDDDEDDDEGFRR